MDASVLAAFLLSEDLSGAAQACSGETMMAAPDFIRLELASAAATAVWRGRLSEAEGSAIVAAAADVVDVFVPSSALAVQAFTLAARLKCSAYDGSYLALAMERDTVLVTADRRLAEKARAGGLGRYVELLGTP